jgi:tetratricopeptide (TPR) repeat protein
LALQGQSDHVFTLAATLANESITNEQKAVLQLYRGMAFAHQGDHNKAIAEFSEAIRNRPNLLGAYRHRGVAYGSKGEYDKAIADFTQTIMLDPEDGFAYYLRAKSYEAKGDRSKAEADFAQAKKLGYKAPR